MRKESYQHLLDALNEDLKFNPENNLPKQKSDIVKKREDERLILEARIQNIRSIYQKKVEDLYNQYNFQFEVVKQQMQSEILREQYNFEKKMEQFLDTKVYLRPTKPQQSQQQQMQQQYISIEDDMQPHLNQTSLLSTVNLQELFQGQNTQQGSKYSTLVRDGNMIDEPSEQNQGKLKKTMRNNYSISTTNPTQYNKENKENFNINQLSVNKMNFGENKKYPKAYAYINAATYNNSNNNNNNSNNNNNISYCKSINGFINCNQPANTPDDSSFLSKKNLLKIITKNAKSHQDDSSSVQQQDLSSNSNNIPIPFLYNNNNINANNMFNESKQIRTLSTNCDQRSFFDFKQQKNKEELFGSSNNESSDNDEDDEEGNDSQLNTNRLKKFKIQPIQKLQQQIKMNASYTRKNELSNCNKTFN